MFIVLEGGEASGKSTTISLLKDRLEDMGHKVLVTREPGGNDISEDIREVIMKHPEIPVQVETMLFNAARYMNVQNIKTKLEEGYIVLCDRYTDSTLVYQGMMKGHKLSEVNLINEIGADGLDPDIVLVLDIPSEVAEERLKTRGFENRFDEMSLEDRDLIRYSFLNLAEKNKKSLYKVIDTTGDIGASLEDIIDLIKEKNDL